MRRSRPHRAMPSRPSAARPTPIGREAELPELLLAALAGTTVALPTALAGEMALCPGIAPIPGSDPALLGMVAVRARPLVAICPAWLLGLEARPAPTAAPLPILILLTAWGRIALPLDQRTVRPLSAHGLMRTPAGSGDTGAAPLRLSGMPDSTEAIPLLDAAACDRRLGQLHRALAAAF